MAREAPSWIKDGSLAVEALRSEVACCTEKLRSGTITLQQEGAEQLLKLIMCVWSLETHLARDSADLVCDEIRTDGGLEAMLHICACQDAGLRLAVGKALEQVMVSMNRHYIAQHSLFDALTGVACSRESLEAIQCGTGILENLFKESAETCLRLIQGGALKALINACRSSDPTTLQHCAAALANCAMYGEHKCQTAMVAKNADHWLFPLAFSKDSIVKYYALLTICFLAANVDLATRVAQSGTLDLVLPFLHTMDPVEFARSCPNHAHGRSAGWLKRLVPLLVSQSEEARSLAAFHFAMEAAIKKKQQRLHIFTDIDAISHLQIAAKQGSRLTAQLCSEALTLSSAPLPPYQCWEVLNWTPDHVKAWVEDSCMRDLASVFPEHLVTGNILLGMTAEDLLEVGCKSRLKCKWFLEQVRKLRCRADVSAQDKDDICKWLTAISKDLEVYKVDFVQRGITKDLLPHLTGEILVEIGVCSAVDRLKILLAIERIPEDSGRDTPDSEGPVSILESPSQKKKYDVFVSYRRATGSQLASLLKVHLQLKGLSVFLDVAGLGSGKFDKALLTTISNSRNVLLVLTPQSLDRCIGDTMVQDWVHREILCALDSKVHVVPVIDPLFKWPVETTLPEDIRRLAKFNGVTWSHEYQDASVEKLVSFLRLPSTTLFRKTKISTS